MLDRSSRSRLERRTRGLWAHVQPVFLLPGAATSGFGALLAADVAAPIAAVHAVAVALAVYVAHLRDGYVDYYVRGEDVANPLEPGEIRLAIAAATALFAGCLLALWVAAGPVGVVPTAPLLALGYLHAPHLDATPVAGTVDYPLGIVLATAGGYAAQTGTVSPAVLAVCLVFFLLLVAINLMLDRLDYDADRRVGKRTVPVAVGPDRALRASLLLVFASVAALAASSLAGPLPQRALLAGLVPAGAAVGCLLVDPSPDRVVGLFIGATYAFAGLLALSLLLAASI